MLVGLVGYFVYRRFVEGISVTDRVTVPEQALQKQIPDVELDSVLVPVFGEGLDDEIVSTAGRLADSDPLPGQSKPRLEFLYVIKLPLTVPLDAPPPPERLREAERALARAMEIAEEYPSVESESGWVAARSIGAAIVEEARERAVEAIIIGGEPPSRIRGGAVLGGVRGAKPAEIGPTTEYVLRNAPCRVLLTAPPEAEPEPIAATPDPLAKA
jgi:APA family basic amino acid/polyamine antiporter